MLLYDCSPCLIANVHSGRKNSQHSGLFNTDNRDSSVHRRGLWTKEGCFEGRGFGASQLKWSVSTTTESICSPAPVLILSQFRGVCVILEMALSIWLLD